MDRVTQGYARHGGSASSAARALTTPSPKLTGRMHGVDSAADVRGWSSAGARSMPPNAVTAPLATIAHKSSADAAARDTASDTLPALTPTHISVEGGTASAAAMSRLTRNSTAALKSAIVPAMTMCTVMRGGARSVGTADGTADGARDGARDTAAADGDSVGGSEGLLVDGEYDGSLVKTGEMLGGSAGVGRGIDGAAVGDSEGDSEGVAVIGATVGLPDSTVGMDEGTEVGAVVAGV